MLGQTGSLYFYSYASGFLATVPRQSAYCRNILLVHLTWMPGGWRRQLTLNILLQQLRTTSLVIVTDNLKSELIGNAILKKRARDATQNTYYLYYMIQSIMRWIVDVTMIWAVSETKVKSLFLHLYFNYFYIESVETALTFKMCWLSWQSSSAGGCCLSPSRSVSLACSSRNVTAPETKSDWLGVRPKLNWAEYN